MFEYLKLATQAPLLDLARRFQGATRQGSRIFPPTSGPDARILVFAGGDGVRSAKHRFPSLEVVMPVSLSRSWLILLLLLLCASSSSVFAAGKRKPKAPAKQEQPAPPTPAPVEAPTPAELTLEQKPAVPPQVTYDNRQLTIVAANSTLGDILRAVKAKTGASIDLPPNANSRVVAHFGPGPSRDVLATLLNGTLFNYVLLGTATDPTAVGKIILTPKPSGPDQPSVAANNPPQPYVQQPNYYPTANVPDQSGDEVESDSETEAEQPPPADQNQQPGAATPNGQANPRTPEQLLQELQRQQLLQQIQRQQQGNPTPQPNPEQ